MAPGHSAGTKAKREREEILEDVVKRIQEGEFEGIRETGILKATLYGWLHGTKPKNKSQKRQ